MKTRQLARIQELSELPDNWDFHGAKPVNKEVIDRVRSIVEYGEERYLGMWNIWPELDGSVVMTLKSLEIIAAISVRADYYSRIIKDGKERISSDKLTDWINLVSVFNRISENFGHKCY